MPYEKIAYIMEGGRKASVLFVPVADGVRIEETFELETKKPEEIAASWMAGNKIDWFE